MSLPREHYREELFCSTVEGESSIFGERSKTQEHTDRFEVCHNSQKTDKNEEN